MDDTTGKYGGRPRAVVPTKRQMSSIVSIETGNWQLATGNWYSISKIVGWFVILSEAKDLRFFGFASE